MRITVDADSDGPALVALEGRLDLSTATLVRQRLAELVASGSRRLVIDLGDVSFIDSTGLGTLVSGYKAARLAGGDVRLARPSDQARVILQLTTLERVLKPYDSIEEALAGF